MTRRAYGEGSLGFVVPSDADRAAAAGRLAALPETLRRAVDSGVDFRPLPPQGRDDWLANHPEPGQGFDQFVRSRPNRPDARRNVLYLQPLGNFDAAQSPPLEQLREFTAAFFTLEAYVLPQAELGQHRIRSRQNPWTGNEQLLTTDILDTLRRRIPADAFAFVGITMTDLYPDPAWNFVFGQASLRERVGVYSFARYDPRFYGEPDTRVSRHLVLRRSAKVLAHETGHMFGIQHCIWYRCLMNGSNHLVEADARPLHLCPVDLRKLHWSIGFDVIERYRHLRDFAGRAGFDDEAEWLDRRSRFIAGHRAGGMGI